MLPCQLCCKRKNEWRLWFDQVLIAIVGCVSELIKNITTSADVPWKFEADECAWSSKLDCNNGPYLQNTLKSCKTSQNTAEKRDSRNIHTIPPSLRLSSLHLLPLKGAHCHLSQAYSGSTYENLTATWNTCIPYQLRVLLWLTKS